MRAKAIAIECDTRRIDYPCSNSVNENVPPTVESLPSLPSEPIFRNKGNGRIFSFLIIPRQKNRGGRPRSAVRTGYKLGGKRRPIILGTDNRRRNEKGTGCSFAGALLLLERTGFTFPPRAVQNGRTKTIDFCPFSSTSFFFCSIVK